MMGEDAAATNTASSSQRDAQMDQIAKVGSNQPWQWLAAGWEDLARARWTSVVWGLLFAGVGLGILLILHRYRLYNLVLPLVAGFMLIAPILAVGLYHVSREIEKGRSVGLGTALGAWKRNPGQVALLGFVLGLFFLFWIRLATLIFAVFFGQTPPEAFGSAPPDILTFIQSVVLSAENLGFLLVGTAIGAVLAVIVYAIAVISAPMLVDRDVSVFHAIVTSVRTVQKNKKAMLLWGVLIVLFTGAGILAGFVGLAFTMPLVAHASWHAYRDLVPVTPSSDSD